MKKILLICLATLLGAGISMAAKPAAGKKTAKTVFVTDIDCDHCVKKIMDNVPSLGKGVKDVEVDLAKKEVTVTYDPAKTNDAQLVRGFASLRVKAEPKGACDAGKYSAAPGAAKKHDHAGEKCDGKCGGKHSDKK